MRVAKEVGPSLQAVARQSYALTLYTFLVLLDNDRIEGAVDRVRTIDSASLAAIAFHEPKKLRDIERSAFSKSGAPVSKTDRAAKMQQAKELIERVRTQGGKSNGQ